MQPSESETPAASEPADGRAQAASPDTWLAEHGDCLYRTAILRVRNPDIAADLVQDTLLAALRTVENFGGRSSVRTWLLGILKHKISDHFRKLGRETSFTDLAFSRTSARTNSTGTTSGITTNARRARGKPAARNR